jgi:hypothetical protein
MRISRNGFSTMGIGVEVVRLLEREEHWENEHLEESAGDIERGRAPHAVSALPVASHPGVLVEIAQTPAANMTDVAVKIGVVERELRNRNGDRMLAQLLSSAERDCRRMSGSACFLRYATATTTILGLLSTYLALVRTFASF